MAGWEEARANNGWIPGLAVVPQLYRRYYWFSHIHVCTLKHHSGGGP